MVMSVNININWNQIQGRIDEATQAAQFMVDSDVLKDSNYYIPEDTGEAQRSGITNSVLGSGKVTWRTPYIRKIYYVPMNFSKDRNPNAGNLWFEAAKSQYLPTWLDDAKNAYRSFFSE